MTRIMRDAWFASFLAVCTSSSCTPWIAQERSRALMQMHQAASGDRAQDRCHRVSARMGPSAPRRRSAIARTSHGT